MDFHDAVKEYEKSTKPKKHKKSGLNFKHNMKASPGVAQSIDDLGCYNWLRMKSFMWSGFVLGSIIMLTFLPVRLIFYTYVSPNWLGNLGLLSLIAALTFGLVYYGRNKKNLLGKFSLAYRQRMSRFIHRKRSVPMFLGMQFFMIIVYVSVFYMSSEDVSISTDDTPEINEYNMSTMYSSIPIGTMNDIDKDHTISSRITNFDPESLNDGKYTTEILALFSDVLNNDISDKDIMYDFYKNSRHSEPKIKNIPNEPDQIEMFSSLPSSMDSFSDGWSSHFLAVWLIADIEYTALFFTYRRVYKKVDIGLPWKAVDAWKSRRGGFLYPVEIIKERQNK